MKPRLLIGLGHDDMGDEGVGGHIAAELFGDGRLPEDTEVRWGRMNLDSLGEEVQRRERIVVLHALYDDIEVGEVEVLRDSVGTLEEHESKIPFLPVHRAKSILRAKRDVPTSARVTFMAVGIDEDVMASDLSPYLSREVPGIVDEVLYELSRST